MCGITGFINHNLKNDDARQLLDRMCHVMRHRGPDDQGLWTGDGTGLGMRRLAIIDIPSGHQPIFNEDNSVVIVFNGEIYNYHRLRDDLCLRGHRFTTQSDTEVIIHAYEEYGDNCISLLDGMFALAIWDRRRQRLLLARDRFGKKPLHYYWNGQQFIFGSEIKSLLEAHIPRAVNHQALDEFLVYRYVPGPYTLFAGVMKLPAAHMLIYEQGKIRLQRYWDLSFDTTCHDDQPTAIERIRTLLTEAVRVRLMSEVPLGAFLSGGVDSSVVVALMSQLTNQPVKTFSIGFADDPHSELPYARQIAQHFGTDHREFIVHPDLVSILPQLVWAYDEPFGDSSMLPTYYVSKLAREHVTVVLTGDGGDEIFAGYRHYAREQVISRIPLPLRYILKLGSYLLQDGMRGKKRLANLMNSLPQRYVQSTMVFPVGSRSDLFTPEYFEHIQRHNPFARQMNLFPSKAHLDVVTQMQYADTHGYLTDDILVKVDKASMLNSLEARTPLLDHHLAEYVASLPPRLRMYHGTLKYLLKKASEPWLPPEILTRKKQGFTMPMSHWFRHGLINFAYDVLTSSNLRERGIINPHFVQHLLNSHQNNSLVDHSSAIWCLMCLELWFQTYMDVTTRTTDYATIVSTS